MGSNRMRRSLVLACAAALADARDNLGLKTISVRVTSGWRDGAWGRDSDVAE